MKLEGNIFVQVIKVTQSVNNNNGNDEKKKENRI